MNAFGVSETFLRQTDQHPPTQIPPDLDEFAVFYTDKIEGIRHAISTSNKNVGRPPCSGKGNNDDML